MSCSIAVKHAVKGISSLSRPVEGFHFRGSQRDRPALRTYITGPASSHVVTFASIEQIPSVRHDWHYSENSGYEALSHSFSRFRLP
jgi:hypothetical protein